MELPTSEVVSINGGEHNPRRAHILMLLLEEQGHYTVFLQLLYALSSYNDITVTVCTSERRVQHLQGLSSEGEFKSLDLRLVPLSDDVSQAADKPGGLPPLFGFVRNLKAQFQPYREKLAAETNADAKPTCLIADCLLPWTEEVAEELQIPRYLLNSGAGWSIYTALKAKIEASEKMRDEIVEVPGQFTAPAKDAPAIIYPLVNCQNLAGILINTYEELEGEALLEATRTYLQHMTTTSRSKVPRFLPIGPLVHTPSYSSSIKDSGRESKALEWLDQQPASSVVYIAFGTMAKIPAPLIFELARGLELSGVRFLWVLRHSDPSVDISTLFPPGFLDCVKTRGFLETSWAPQLQVLQHPSTGGFISHCGWNSSIESISSGVPVLTWHVHGDQPLNARFIVESLKAGLFVRKHESPTLVVRGEDVATAIDSLMTHETGTKLRKNIAQLKESALRSMQDGGSSQRNLHRFVDEIRSH